MIPEYNWIPAFSQLFNKVSLFRKGQDALIAMLNQAEIKNTPPEGIDPFTFINCIVMHGDARRIEILKVIFQELEISHPVPDDFRGLPSAHPKKAWMFGGTNQEENIDVLWDLFEGVLRGKIDLELFNKARSLYNIGAGNLTQGMFRVRPNDYFPIDSQTTKFLALNNIDIKVDKWQDYGKILSSINSKWTQPYWEISQEVYQGNQEHKSEGALCLVGTSKDFDEYYERLQKLIETTGKATMWWDFRVHQDYHFKLNEPFHLYLNTDTNHISHRYSVEAYVTGAQGQVSPWQQHVEDQFKGITSKNGFEFRSWFLITNMEKLETPLSPKDFTLAPKETRLLHPNAFGYALDPLPPKVKFGGDISTPPEPEPLTPRITTEKAKFNFEFKATSMAESKNIAPNSSSSPALGVLEQVWNFVPLLQNINQPSMIGLFGQWGRGKTFFVDHLQHTLKFSGHKELKDEETILENFPDGDKAEKSKILKLLPQYSKITSIKFEAWKYQDTPAIWAYLYEELLDNYLKLDPTNEELNFFERIFEWAWSIKKIFWLNSFKLGWWGNIKLYSGWLSALYIANKAGALIPSEMLLFSIENPKLALGGWTLGLGVFSQWAKMWAPFRKRFGPLMKAKRFDSVLGLQKQVQDEIKSLLKVWFPSPKEHKLILIIDDLDRCPENRILTLIDALRVMLEDKEISDRCTVLMSIDERILRLAIDHKYANLFQVMKDLDGGEQKKSLDKMKKLAHEYMEKLFIFGFKLQPLNNDEKQTILASYLNDISNEGNDGVQAALTERLKGLEAILKQMEDWYKQLVEDKAEIEISEKYREELLSLFPDQKPEVLAWIRQEGQEHLRYIFNYAASITDYTDRVDVPFPASEINYDQWCSLYQFDPVEETHNDDELNRLKQKWKAKPTEELADSISAHLWISSTKGSTENSKNEFASFLIEALQKFPKEIALILNYAKKLYSMGKQKEADFLAQLIEKREDNTEVEFGWLADYYGNVSEQPKKAIDALEKLHATDPQNLDYLSLLHQMYKVSKQSEKLADIEAKIAILNRFDKAPSLEEPKFTNHPLLTTEEIKQLQDSLYLIGQVTPRQIKTFQYRYFFAKTQPEGKKLDNHLLMRWIAAASNPEWRERLKLWLEEGSEADLIQNGDLNNDLDPDELISASKHLDQLRPLQALFIESEMSDHGIEPYHKLLQILTPY